MKGRVFFIPAVILLASVSIAQAADIQGTFLLVPQKSDNVVQIVESTVSRMNIFIRGIAREKIRKAAKVNQMVSITSSEKGITIHADDRTLPTAPADGTKAIYQSPSGDILDVRMRLEGKRLEQTFQSQTGTRTNLCELSQDGNELDMRVVIRSDHLEKPITYKLVYQKIS